MSFSLINKNVALNSKYVCTSRFRIAENETFKFLQLKKQQQQQSKQKVQVDDPRANKVNNNMTISGNRSRCTVRFHMNH